jgi:hypothetical protein
MQIVESDVQSRNAPVPISESLEPASKTTDESDRHPKKQQRPSVSIEEGMQTDESDEQS